MQFTEYRPGLWCLKELYTRCFLVIGTRQALLFDSGLGSVDCAGMARKLTQLPITYVNSHGHTDHIGANLSFTDGTWAHPAEIPYLTKAIGHGVIYHEAVDGHIFDLGGTRLKVLHLPGHTPGSIALLEEGGGYLLCADLVSTDHVFLTGDYDIQDYCDSLERVLSLSEITEKTAIYPAHGQPEVSVDLLARERNLAMKIMAGLPPVRQESIPRDVRLDGCPSFQIPRIMDVFQDGTETIFRDAN